MEEGREGRGRKERRKERQNGGRKRGGKEKGKGKKEGKRVRKSKYWVGQKVRSDFSVEIFSQPNTSNVEGSCEH